ncbi:MAG: DUF3298 and DUF4163 domain-containing protein [Clostridia bacterium]|nr:DUF3298 and DUF4163 domain-containing protein [Clostridia bacterium]
MNTSQSPVQIITRQIIKPAYGMHIDYPVAIGMKNSAVQKKINDAILHLVNQLIYDQTNQLISVQGYPQPLKLTVRGFYEIKNNQRDVLSLSIGNYTMAYPAAHGLTVVKSLTFDITTGKIYQLPELFKPGSDYVKVLSDLIAQQIKTRDLHTLDEFKGIRPDQDFYIADKILVIYFQTYEITAYVYGLPEFPITVYQIEDIIASGSPLMKML